MNAVSLLFPATAARAIQTLNYYTATPFSIPSLGNFTYADKQTWTSLSHILLFSHRH